MRYIKKINRLFVSKFYHDRKNSNFLKNLKYIGEKNKIDKTGFSEIPEFGRKLYEYQKNTDLSDFNVNINIQDWHFPKKYFKSVGYTVDRFKFSFPKAKASISDILNPTKNLFNIENGLEEASNSFISEIFSPNKENIEDEIAEYNNFPTKHFVNETYFLYDESNLIKQTFVTAINKTLSLYGSFSFFSGKTAKDELKLLDSSNFLNFLVEKQSLKDSLKFQLAHIDGRNPKTKDKK